MQIDKDQIISFLKSKGDNDKAEQANKELPQQVDTEKDAGLLSSLGIDVQDLLAGAGGIAGKLGL